MRKFFAFLNRMKYINRWSLMRSTVSENIMEHSQQVAVVAHSLAVIGNTYFGQNLDADSIAVKALFHECSEVITGDLPTPIKYINHELNSAYKQIENAANDKLLTYLPPEMKNIYADILKNPCETEKKYVKYADKLCAYIKCIEELKTGNKEFSQAAETIKKELIAYNSKEVNYFMSNFVPAYELTLDELNGQSYD